MLKTIQMQKAKPTQKQNKKPTHNAGKITKKKLKKPRFIGGEKKNISKLSIKEKLEFLKHCLNNTIHGDLRQILYTANANALKYFPTYEVGYIDMFKIVIKYVLLCLINNRANSDYKDITRSNNCYLLLKNKCPYKRCQYSIDFESEKDLDSNEEEELNKIADQYYDTFKKYVSEIVEKPHDNIIINKYIKAIYPGGIAILTKKSDNNKYDLKINNSETPIEEYSKIIDFLKNNTNTKFLIILKKESSNTDNTDETDVYNCMMQIIMKLVDIFSSENNSKYYERIINGEPEKDVYLSMNEEASIEKLKVAQEERLKEQANQTNKETGRNQAKEPVEQTAEAKAPAKAPETQTTAQTTAQPAQPTLTTAQTTAKEAAKAAKAAKEAEAEAAKAAKEADAEAEQAKAIAIAAAAKVEEEANAKAEKVEKEAKEEAEKAKAEKADKAETIKKRGPDINLDNLLDYIFNGGAQVFDLGKHAILLKSLKMICYNKFSQEIGTTFKEKIDNKYIAKINETNTANKKRIIDDSEFVFFVNKQKCDSNDMIEAYQHIINILVPKYGLDITEECYETLIALSSGRIYGDCKKTIGDILTQKSYLLSEPKIKDLLIRKCLNDLGNLKSIAIEELNNFKDKVLNILNEIFDVPAYKETESKVLKIYNSLRDIIVKDYEGNRDLIGVLDDDIVHIYRITKNSKTYSNIQKTPEEIKFDKLLDIIFKIFKIFQDIKTITGKSFSYTKHGIILRSLKLICYNKLNKLFRNYSEHIDSKYIDELIKMNFARQNIEGNESFKKHKSIVGISGTQYCNKYYNIEAYQDIINILYQGKTKPNIEDIKISLLIDLSTGNSSPDCKNTIKNIINDESYLLSESRIMDIELDGDFLITSWDKKKTYSSEDKAVSALKNYNETIKKTIDKATIYDIKNKLWKDYDDLSKKIKLQYTNNLNIVGALPAINKPETPTKNRKAQRMNRTMATNMR